MSQEEFRRISTVSMAKEAWTIPETTHEPINYKCLFLSLKRLDWVKMRPFEELYAKLVDIENSTYNLGETIDEPKIIISTWKIST